MVLDVNEGLEITNIDNNWLSQIKKENGTFDNGASKILEGLAIFADDILSKYEDEPEIPYEKLFYALKQIITSGSERTEVRDAIVTGIIVEKKRGVQVHKVKKVATIKKPARKNVTKNLAAIANYARNHTKSEITEHFNFETEKECSNYLYCHKVKYVHGKMGRRKIKIDEQQLIKLASCTTVQNMAVLLGCSESYVKSYMKEHGIKHVPQRRKKENYANE